jgi:hypothetical protein
MAKSRNRHTTDVAEKNQKNWHGSEPTLWKKIGKKPACLIIETGTKHKSRIRSWKKNREQLSGARSVRRGMHVRSCRRLGTK